MLHPLITYYLVGLSWFCYLMIHNEKDGKLERKEIEMTKFKSL